MVFWQRHRVAVLSMGISVLLHILLFVGTVLWIPKPEKRTFRVQFVSRVPVLISRVFRVPDFRPVGPEVKMEMLRREEGPADIPEVALPPLALTTEPVDQARLRAPLAGWDKGKGPVRVPSDTTTLEESAWKAHLKYMEQKEHYRWLPFVSADTSDAESVRRRMAQQIIDRAIEGLGGLQALVGIQDKVVTYRIEKHPTDPLYHRTATTYHRRLRYLSIPYPGIRIGYDGKRAWRDWYGLITPAWGLSRKAERWDFLSTFRGDGVELNYVGWRVFEGRNVHEIELKDLKYGLKETAFFDMQTCLPAGVITPAVNFPMNICSWPPGSRIAVVYGEYVSINGVMTATRTEEYLSGDVQRPMRHIISLRTRYNEGLDDAIFQNPDGRLKERPDLVAAANILVSQEVFPRSQYSLGINFQIAPELRPPLCIKGKPCIKPLEKSLMHQTIIRTFAASKLFHTVVPLGQFWLVDSDIDVDYVLLCRIVDGGVVSSCVWLKLEVNLCTQAGDMLWKSSPVRVKFQTGPTSLITDVSAASIAGTIFNTLGGAFGSGLISLLDHPTP